MKPVPVDEKNLSPLLLALLERLRNMFPDQPLELDPGWEQRQMPPNAADHWGGRMMNPLNRGNQGLRIQDLLDRGQKAWGE